MLIRRLIGVEKLKLNYRQFCEKVDMCSKKELDKVTYTAFFNMVETNSSQFSLSSIIEMLSNEGYHISNNSRIKKYLKDSKEFRKIKDDEYILSAVLKVKLNEKLNFIKDIETIESDGTLFDESLFCGHRGYLTKLFKQANHCYEHNCYDACAVMIRRILEIFLIHSYETLKIEQEIKNPDGTYFMLERICANAKNNKMLNLSRSKMDLDSIRDLGNYAAHKITYNTCKKDIDDLKVKIRVCFEELLYKSEIKK